ncbi:MAG TPA: DNA replication and repair protein RecF [Chitinophagaceae bacterium]
MLRVKSIQLLQFRNYASGKFEFPERITGICGANGTGKTNLLDAVHYLCLTRSYFPRPDVQNVTHGTQGMRIEGIFSVDRKEYDLVCIIRENNRKTFSVNGEPYKKMSQHLGRFPCVMIAPDDAELVTGHSETRRNFFDPIICQVNEAYLQELIGYNKLLQHRNSFLKQAAESNQYDRELLETLDVQLSKSGAYIYSARSGFMNQFLPLVLHHYRKIATQDDDLQLVYESQLSQNEMRTLLAASLQKDLALQRTTSGIHRDDLNLLMKNLPFKSQASQGQRKSLLFALKLAEWDILREQKGFAPLLLLDDVFEKLDERRMHNLLHWVCAENEGQVLITDTHRQRLTRQLEDIGVNFRIIELS